MKILHYSLGVPGFRSGGLTKYSMDLMIEEAKFGNEVFLIYPGEMTLSKETFIKRDKIYEGVKIYEIINPLPVPLTNGVKQPELYCANIIEYKSNFKSWIDKEKFDIVHIHTLMGLPIEFIEAINELEISIVYTTHDYYGICPKVNLVRNNGKRCDNNNDYSACYDCCKNGFSYNKIKIMQSKMYRNIKKLSWGRKVISLIKSKDNKKQVDNEASNEYSDFKVSYETQSKYKRLQDYYYDIFNRVDYYHFNSTISKEIYEKYLGDIDGEVISITHANINDNRHIKSFGERLKMIFLGNDSMHKGLSQLLLALESIDTSLENSWLLDIWGVEGESNYSNIVYKGKYSYNMLEVIFGEADLLVIPSMCYETFAFVGLEAYSNGVPVLSTNLVGFNDLIKDGVTGFIVESNTDSLKEKILSIIRDREQLLDVNRNICESTMDFGMESHVEEILELYKKVNGRSI
ncbi:MAG: glycosyltransferase [Clostridium sp.]|jgi:glycosyltransferase involved in cell wall biosynthesis|uniref:glycosyltransferase n=1 Tax=Clostridium TaxID=1485 RepID=UPI0022E80996|nr:MULTISPECIES: glycosyltransferase [Clostridium]MDU2461175.1 glycosyltransferase [Clostridium sp.]MDU4738897.1 glycosyltransferase [Clostridium sp.]MDU7949451.1 glycosyltransferase [Clostridium sp.]